jgi:hypothetical protein
VFITGKGSKAQRAVGTTRFYSADSQRFLCHDKQKTTEIYAGHLETSTKEQTDFLGDFWDRSLSQSEKTTSFATITGKKKG